jgi:2-C-methyl-D-erythritol 4-phosphate cytidylyltransferase
MIHSDSSSTSMQRLWALIPSAGNGSRAAGQGTTLPKQYQMLAGQPMVLHTLAAFAAVPGLSGTLVVVSPRDSFLKSSPPAYEVATCGGASRAASVANGLAHLAAQGAHEEDWVLVHDAARCLVTPEQISQLIDACKDDKVGGLLALPLPDTLKSEIQGRVGATVDRSDKWLAQTPQMFRLGLLRKALAQAGDQVTDESSAIEALGLAPRLVIGSAQNFKLTYGQDFALAQAVLQSRQVARSSP